VPSILELHAAWEAMFVDDVNIGDTTGRSAQPEKSLPDMRKRFHAAMVSASFEDLVESVPRSCPRNFLTSCMCLDISHTKTQCPAENVCNLWL
jgi:hypothetical protein